MSRKCFVITPLGAANSEQRSHADRVWDNVLTPVFHPAGYELIRSDKMDDPGQITDAIFRCIAESEMCIADLSFLNPNVMYELGVRHCLRLPTIQIKSEPTPNPFDTKNQRTIEFDVDSPESLNALKAEVIKQLSWIERNPGVVSNPLTNAIQRSPGDFEAERTAKEIAGLARRLGKLESRLASQDDQDAPSVITEGDTTRPEYEALKDAANLSVDDDGIGWTKTPDGSYTARFADFDIALRPQSKGRWSSSAVHALNGFSVTYPRWRGTIENAKKAIIAAIVEEEPYWRRL
jgi:hypothetical protein